MDTTQKGIRLKIGAVPSVFSRAESIGKPHAVDDSNDEITPICVCNSDCDKIGLIKTINELREEMKNKDKENEELKHQYTLATKSFAKKSSALRKKVIFNRTKVYRLSSTRSKLNSAIKELKKRQILTDNECAKNLQVFLWLFHIIWVFQL